MQGKGEVGRVGGRQFAMGGHFISEMYLANCICQMQKIGLIEFCISTGGRREYAMGGEGTLELPKVVKNSNANMLEIHHW